MALQEHSLLAVVEEAAVEDLPWLEGEEVVEEAEEASLIRTRRSVQRYQKRKEAATERKDDDRSLKAATQVPEQQ